MGSCQYCTPCYDPSVLEACHFFETFSKAAIEKKEMTGKLKGQDNVNASLNILYWTFKNK